MASTTEAFFNVEFWRAMVATWSGAGLALLIALFALWLQGRGSRRAGDFRRSQLAQALMGSLQKNADNIQEGLMILESGVVTLGTVKLTLLESTASLKYELIRDLDLNRDIDSLHDLLAELGRYLSVRSTMEFSAYRSEEAYARESEIVDNMIQGGAKLFVETLKETNVLERLSRIGTRAQ